MEPRLQNKTQFKEFQPRAAAIGHHDKTILFHFRRGPMLK